MLLLLLAGLAWGQSREVGGHRFPMPVSVLAPFPTRHFGLSQGASLLRVPEVRVNNRDEPITLALVGATEAVSIGVGLAERLSLFADGQGELLAGANQDSALVVGARAATTGEVGVLYAPFRWSWGGQLGFHGGLRASRGLAVEPITLVEALLEDSVETIEDVFTDGLTGYLLVREQGWSQSAGTSLAYGHGRLGLMGSAQLRVGRVTRSRVDASTPAETTALRTVSTLGGACSVHLDPVPLVPQLELRYRLDAEGIGVDELETVTRSRLRATLGTYLDRDDFQLGGFVSTALVRASTGLDEQQFSFAFRLRYFFR